MMQDALDAWHHGHSFGQEIPRPGEWRTIVVIVLTSTMMVVEVVGGWWFGSMALLADGLHMASHAAALSISAFAYIYTRRHAHDRRYSFGTGKVNALGGHTSAVLLLVFAALMVWESLMRMLNPVPIAFDQAVVVAVVGLVVNGVSALILRHESAEGDENLYEDRAAHLPVETEQPTGHDHNLRAAYLHVVADAMTSVLAIVALLAGKWLGWTWLDSTMGIVGALLVGRWSLGLLGTTTAVLLDRQGPKSLEELVRRSIEGTEQARVTDLHLWSIGPGIWAVELVVVATQPQAPDYYKSLLPRELGLVHATVEVHRYEQGNGTSTACSDVGRDVREPSSEPDG